MSNHNITTTYKTNGKGTGQILAKGGGKQRTVTYDPAVSVDRNHGLAAGTLADVLFQGATSRRLAAERYMHVHLHDGRHQFRMRAGSPSL